MTTILKNKKLGDVKIQDAIKKLAADTFLKFNNTRKVDKPQKFEEVTLTKHFNLKISTNSCIVGFSDGNGGKVKKTFLTLKKFKFLTRKLLNSNFLISKSLPVYLIELIKTKIREPKFSRTKFKPCTIPAFLPQLLNPRKMMVWNYSKRKPANRSHIVCKYGETSDSGSSEQQKNIGDKNIPSWEMVVGNSNVDTSGQTAIENLETLRIGASLVYNTTSDTSIRITQVLGNSSVNINNLMNLNSRVPANAEDLFDTSTFKTTHRISASPLENNTGSKIEIDNREFTQEMEVSMFVDSDVSITAGTSDVRLDFGSDFAIQSGLTNPRITADSVSKNPGLGLLGPNISTLQPLAERCLSNKVCVVSTFIILKLLNIQNNIIDNMGRLERNYVEGSSNYPNCEIQYFQESEIETSRSISMNSNYEADGTSLIIYVPRGKEVIYAGVIHLLLTNNLPFELTFGDKKWLPNAFDISSSNNLRFIKIFSYDPTAVRINIEGWNVNQLMDSRYLGIITTELCKIVPHRYSAQAADTFIVGQYSYWTYAQYGDDFHLNCPQLNIPTPLNFFNLLQGQWFGLFDQNTPFQQYYSLNVIHRTRLESSFVHLMDYVLRHGIDNDKFFNRGDSVEVQKLVDSNFEMVFRGPLGFDKVWSAITGSTWNLQGYHFFGNLYKKLKIAFFRPINESVSNCAYELNFTPNIVGFTGNTQSNYNIMGGVINNSIKVAVDLTSNKTIKAEPRILDPLTNLVYGAFNVAKEYENNWIGAINHSDGTVSMSNFDIVKKIFMNFNKVNLSIRTTKIGFDLFSSEFRTSRNKHIVYQLTQPRRVVTGTHHVMSVTGQNFRPLNEITILKGLLPFTNTTEFERIKSNFTLFLQLPRTTLQKFSSIDSQYDKKNNRCSISFITHDITVEERAQVISSLNDQLTNPINIIFVESSEIIPASATREQEEEYIEQVTANQDYEEDHDADDNIGDNEGIRTPLDFNTSTSNTIQHDGIMKQNRNKPIYKDQVVNRLMESKLLIKMYPYESMLIQNSFRGYVKITSNKVFEDNNDLPYGRTSKSCMYDVVGYMNKIHYGDNINKEKTYNKYNNLIVSLFNNKSFTNLTNFSSAISSMKLQVCIIHRNELGEVNSTVFKVGNTRRLSFIFFDSYNRHMSLLKEEFKVQFFNDLVILYNYPEFSKLGDCQKIKFINAIFSDMAYNKQCFDTTIERIFNNTKL